MTDYEKGEILDFKQVWTVGPDCKDKIKASPLAKYNQGFDDEKGDYNVRMDDHIAYRYEVKDKLGKGSFGQALKCWDHKHKTWVALKIIRNKKKFQHQAGVEVKILKYLK
jgi:dual specificity tyrosine-phosphorylation-regulated kinase 2/3/4